jgi:hypothetical protein
MANVFSVDLSTLPPTHLLEAYRVLDDICGLPSLLWELRQNMSVEIEHRAPTEAATMDALDSLLMELHKYYLCAVLAHGDNPDVDALLARAEQALEQALEVLHPAVPTT